MAFGPTWLLRFDHTDEKEGFGETAQKLISKGLEYFPRLRRLVGLNCHYGASPPMTEI